MSLRTPGHFHPDLLIVFYMLSTTSFRFPCIFLNYDLLKNMCYGHPVNVFKEKINSDHPDKLPGVQDT